jgi:hypothetical protein
MKQMVRGCILAAAVVASMALQAAAADSADKVNEAYRPTLFKLFGDIVNVPDGLAQDKDGNLYLSAPNFVDKSYPGVIMKRCAKTGKWSVFVAGLLHPDTKRGAPMGLEFGDDGNLYYCDNQYFFDKNYKSRILRVVIGEDGEPARIEPVVEGVKLANAIRVRDHAVYFTDTFFDVPGKNLGGVYRVPMSAFKDGPARLLPKEQAANDPYCLGICENKVLPHRNDTAACDGMCFDRDGNIYTGNFGDGRFHVLKVRPDGSYDKPVVLFNDPSVFPCCDGICYYAEKNWVIITDSERNAVRYWDIKAGKLGLLWENDDTCGKDGLLDQPCEPIVWNGKLVIANFDMTFPGLKNTQNDSVHTLSVIDLHGASGSLLW